LYHQGIATEIPASYLSWFTSLASISFNLHLLALSV